jgi:hypothetical protein
MIARMRTGWGAIQSEWNCHVVGQAPSCFERDAGFLGSDSNFHAKHPTGTPEGWWNLAKPQVQDSDPNNC